MGPRDEDRQTRDLRALVDQLRKMSQKCKVDAAGDKTPFMKGYDTGGADAFLHASEWIEELLPARDEVAS